MDALRRGVEPNRTTYVSHDLAPGWLPSAPSYEVQTYSHSYGGSINLVTGDAAVRQLGLRPARRRPRRRVGRRKTARDMGITSPLHGYPAEGLGGLTDGVSPLEMARAYASIANGGYRVKPIVVRKVTFPSGHVDNLGKPSRTKIFDDGVAYEATKILTKNVQAGTGTAAQIGCPAAGKTGTVDNYTDAWFVGFTPRLVTSVWVGHPKDPYPLGPGAAGGVVAAPIWGRYMKSAHGKFCGDFPQPKIPFVAQPFFGKYSRTGAKDSNPDQQQPGATQPGPQLNPNGQGTGKNGGGTKYPPDAYEAPPQTAPNTTQPPATPPAANSPPGAQDGGTGAPAPNPG